MNKARLEPRELNRLIKAASAKLGGASTRSSASTSKRKAKAQSTAGWSCFVSLIGSTSDLMVIHFRETLDGIGAAQSALAQTALARALDPVYAFLSVTEAGLYHISAELAREAEARGGKVGDESYLRSLSDRSEKERASAHVTRRLYPELPADMPYVCFYPMSKRREESQNWYTLSLDERSRLMQSHGLTGRRYAGKVQQVITGAIGLDAWEWGVTLFAKDALDFKKLVTDMRFDEVSAKYAEFGDFYVGRIVTG
jgi:chlorite dismutase